jgi:hypothetical protein
MNLEKSAPAKAKTADFGVQAVPKQPASDVNMTQRHL